MKHYKVRAGVAMIELIFAIVIMGIVLLSAPMLVSTATQSTTVALQQEGISEAASRINMILTYHWDEQNANSVCADFPSVLRVTSGDDQLGRRNTSDTDVRFGVPTGSGSHTFDCGAAELDASAIGMDAGGILDDMDDFNDVTLKNVALGTGGEDYIEQTTVNIATNIKYVPDNADYDSNPQYNFAPTGNSPGTTNIKAIAVTLTSSHGAEELEKEITMHAFSCNIGGYRYDTRVF